MERKRRKMSEQWFGRLIRARLRPKVLEFRSSPLLHSALMWIEARKEALTMTARTVRTLLAVMMTAAWVLPISVPGLAHETGPDATHTHPTDAEQEQDTSEHTDVCVEVVTTLDWEPFSSDSQHAYTGAFDQYSDEMRAMMRLRGTYEECKVLLEPVKRRQVQEWLIGDAERGSWVSECAGNNLPTGFNYMYGVWQNGNPAVNPDTCQRVSNLLNEIPGGLGNDGLWRSRIGALVEDALTSRCSDNLEGPYEQRRCRGTATSANTILNCLDTIVGSLPDDEAGTREMIHDRVFGVEGSNPPDNSGLCPPSATAQPVHQHDEHSHEGDTDDEDLDTPFTHASHEGEEAHFDFGDDDNDHEHDGGGTHCHDTDTHSHTHAHGDLGEHAHTNAHSHNADACQDTPGDHSHSHVIFADGQPEHGHQHGHEHVGTAPESASAHSDADEGATDTATTEGDIESSTTEGAIDTATTEGDIESVADEADTATTEGDIESVADEADTATSEPSVDDEVAGLDLPERVRNAYQGAINAYRARGCTVEVIQSTVTGRYHLRTSCPDR